MRRITISLAVLVAAVLVPQSALSHVERNSYWPDPGLDRSVKGGAGGKVPKARSLSSARRSRRGARVRVVCKPNSLRSAYNSIKSARRYGNKLRPTQPRRRISAKTAAGLRRLNRAFFKRCRYRNIQRAVFRSRNNDRIVVMPGLYTEGPSRAKPKDDPRCADLREKSDKGAGAASYRYQVKCPNDQSLVFVGGRTVSSQAPPQPPRENRHGLPDEGACKRCNLQIEGSGARPEDVRLDAAKDPRRSQLRKLGDSTKDVGIKADRADGLVIRNMTFAHAKEHGIYVHETDGYLLDNVKMFYNGEYGSLTFTSDHGLTSDCESTGHGDSGVYPGSAVNSGEDRNEPAPRLNQAITRCDVYHNTLGYSGTMGNATHVYNNNFYDNSTGVTTDSFFAGGHPGYPQDSAVFENNRIYSNNFNSFAKGSDVIPKIPVPVGTGILIAGGNNNEVRGNKIWDNWRRGAMLMSVPDTFSGENSANSTSHRNRFHDNVMGAAAEGRGLRNGVDFWWDGAPGNADNCWYSNGAVTSDPAAPLLPSNCKNTSSGAVYPSRAPELGGCAASIEFGDETRAGSGSNPKFDEKQCPWFQTPPKPGSSSGSSGSPLSLPKADIAAFERVVRDMCAMTGSTTAPCKAAESR